MSEGKIAFVTGASRGIGQAIALRLGQSDEISMIIGTATSSAGAEKITENFKAAGISGRGLVLNIAEQESVDAAFAEMKADCGMPSILVNNAGITRDNLFLRMKDEEWQTVIDTNLSGVFRVSKACIRSMVKARWGRIITISSVVGVMGNAGQANYAAAKAGVIGFSKSLAREIGSRNITVNVVAPGFIDTDMTRDLPEKQREKLLTEIPAGRLGQAAELAAAVNFLASSDANYITGETLHVNGGMHMC